MRGCYSTVGCACVMRLKTQGAEKRLWEGIIVGLTVTTSSSYARRNEMGWRLRRNFHWKESERKYEGQGWDGEFLDGDCRNCALVTDYLPKLRLNLVTACLKMESWDSARKRYGGESRIAGSGLNGY